MDRKNFRQTENEKFAQQIVDASNTLGTFNMSNDIDSLIKKEKINKFNDQYSEAAKELEEQEKAIKECQEEVMNKLDSIEIKPTSNRLLVKPFAYNPFQKMEMNNGIITDIGGLNPDIEFNNDTGKYQEREQMIKVSVVIEVGPEVKHIQPGDVVFSLKTTLTPVPFFKQGLWLLKEDNVMVIVNDNLSKRFV